jgi:hypothetical protein
LRRRFTWDFVKRRRLLPVALALVLAAVVGAVSLHAATPSGAADASTSAQNGVTETDVFAACEGCHPGYATQPPASPGLIFDHRTHTARGAACIDCHASATGHAGAPAPPMSACFACHEGRKAPADCAYCHSNLDVIAPDLGNPRVHVGVDAQDKATCAGCHDVPAFCTDCHGLEIPHPSDWLPTHGGLGQEQAGLCVKCHQSKDAQFCVRCHGMEMPHPPYWISTHRETATANPASCNLCHKDAPTFCDRCHQAQGIPGAGG